MKNSSSVDIATLTILYKKYKEHIIYLAVIAVCFLVLVFLTLPKLSEISTSGQERKEEEKKLEILKTNSRILQETSESDLDERLKIASSALPESKDFEGILNALSVASSKSGASLKDYEFGVGSLSETESTTQSYPSIGLSLDVSASQAQLTALLKNLSETLPLSEVTGIKGTSSNTSIDMVFYFKASASSDSFTETTPLSDLSDEDKKLMSTLDSWQTFFANVPEFTSSSSASTTPF